MIATTFALLAGLSLGLVGLSLQDTTTQQSPVKTTQSDTELLETGNGTRHSRTAATRSKEIKVVSYNIRWRSGDDLKKLIKLFREDPEIGNAAILGLQEVDRRKKRSGNTNTVKLLADELGLHYAWAAPPTAKSESEEETGVAILSIYPLSDIKRIVLPHEGPNRRRRVALGATVLVEGRKWRVYSAHAETRISTDKKVEQIGAVLKDLAQYPQDMPALVVGDLNTWQSGADRKTIKQFSDAGMKTPFGDDSTFERKVLMVPIQFRLDWVWLRGIEPISYGIDRKIEVSDHWPLWTNVKLPDKAIQ